MQTHKRDAVGVFEAGGREFMTHHRSSWPICWDGRPYRITFGLLKEVMEPVYRLAEYPNEDDGSVNRRDWGEDFPIEWADDYTLFGDGTVAILHRSPVPELRRVGWNDQERRFD
ncbi:hypothetical protein [Magnetospira sp. QH-2]|uniref:hypothetical protein n=1 Tax=Magnetospira sp. (strain QH-2) TaxID=1288970 RepID=UPI0011DE5723|nr:hypothetical protein [Magnetospira sp. QH-2]